MWEHVNWTVVIAGGALALSAVLAVLRGLDAFVKDRAEDVAREALDVALQPVRLELRTMNGELARIRLLEQKLENGLGERQDRVEEKLDAITSILMTTHATVQQIERET